MAQQSNDLRERLLATLPQPENLAAYRKETAVLLAKHARALRWDKITATTLSFIAVVLVFFWGHGPYRAGTYALHYFQAFTGVMFFVGLIYRMRYEIYDSQVATLKEIKQVQLQILELQASLQKEL
jgi:hypothetical protein